MEKLGFPQLDKTHFLFKSTTSSKESRRQFVRKSHRVIVLLGDNLIDLDGSFDKQPADIRMNQVNKLKKQWGERYIVFPNAIYGDWENAFYYNFISSHHGSLPNLDQKDSIRLSNLQGY